MLMVDGYGINVQSVIMLLVGGICLFVVMDEGKVPFTHFHSIVEVIIIDPHRICSKNTSRRMGVADCSRWLPQQHRLPSYDCCHHNYWTLGSAA